MKNILLKSSITIVTLVALTGCGGATPTPIALYKPTKESITISNTEKAVVNNGSITLNNGDKIYDQEGDIKSSFTLNNEVFYLLEIKDKNLYKLKDSSKKTLKEFNSNAISYFISKSEIVLAVSLNGNKKMGFYDNVYKFNGKDLKLINKNLDLHSGTYGSRGRTQ